MSDHGMQIQPGPKNFTSALALANAASIVAGVVKGLAGKDVASSINGSPLVQDTIAQMACTRITSQLQKRLDTARVMRLGNNK